MKDHRVPIVSVVIPTLNASAVLGACLNAIERQRFTGHVEVLVADGGSSDGTRIVAARHGAQVLENPLLTGEAGKAVGAKAAMGEYVAFVDSDNILVGDDWLVRMLAPFADPEIVATEPDRYAARSSDGALTRYFASLGMNDPVCLFLGNYDRYSALTGRWTGLPVRHLRASGYEKVWLSVGAIPTIGANGFVVRRQALLDLGVEDYLFDVDVVHRLVAQRRWAFAKVDCSIVHIFAGDLRTFQRKQRRRIRDYLYYRRQALRTAESRPDKAGLARFALATIAGWPLFWQALRGFVITRDPAWFIHPVACALTLFEYGRGMLIGRFSSAPLSRQGWKQT